VFEVWIPDTDAGHLAEYDYEAGGLWNYLGTVNQEDYSGWYDVGFVPDNVEIQQVRELSAGGSPGPCGPTVCYLAEAAAGFRATF
jgi:hypothetical protein